MSYEGLLLRLSYVAMLSITIVYDMVALVVSFKYAIRMRQVSWILLITAFMPALRVPRHRQYEELLWPAIPRHGQIQISSESNVE